MNPTTLSIGNQYIYRSNGGAIKVCYLGHFPAMPGGDWLDFRIDDGCRNEVLTVSAASIGCDIECVDGKRVDIPYLKEYRPANRARKEDNYNASIRRTANPSGRFYGEVVVFSGKFSKKKRELSSIAADNGFFVETNVTKQTTMLVVGKYYTKALKGKEKSIKQISFESRLSNNAGARIISEADFFNLIGN